jgi:alkanesulfonate monooxygenase SsuD/methylene tetrahydromethanopterin reductase-like flavin-dependent oxidoreductase (luciferase family)
MKLGVTIFPTDTTMSPPELGMAVEERGFESVFFPEHTHIPTSRLSPYPAGGDLPEEYRRTHDPFVALSAVAAVTERLVIGTGICLVVERDPIITAKEVASLDRLSGGRFCSVLEPGGTARRWPTTAPTRGRACGFWSSASRP